MNKYYTIKGSIFKLLISLFIPLFAIAQTDFLHNEMIIKFVDSDNDVFNAQSMGFSNKKINYIDAEVWSIPDTLNFAGETIIGAENIAAYFESFVGVVEYAELNYPLYLPENTNDTHYDKLWGMPKIDAPEAWKIAESEVSCLINDSLALVALYNSTNGPNWTNTWDLTQPVSTWDGVGLSDDGCSIIEVLLINNDLNGFIPIELGNLTDLTHLNLSGNNLEGIIPTELGNLVNLIYLYLSDNNLSGPIPTELSNLVNLTYLYLSDNNLSGPIPTELGNLTDLILLYLADNNLSGPIPPELGNLTDLILLDFSFNNLSGCYPEELCDLYFLTTYAFSNNPDLPDGGSDQGFLDFCNRLINCPDTSTICQLESDSLALVALYNSTNGSNWENTWDLTQPVSTWYGVGLSEDGCSVIEVSLNNNDLSGFIPIELINLIHLTDLELSFNNLSGSIPPELGNLLNLIHLHLSENNLGGSIPPELGNLVNLTHLWLSSNNLSGSIPPELGNLVNLTDLWLSSNNLSGLPPELGNLVNLTYLWLSFNNLSGPIPSELGNLVNLTHLDILSNNLSGPIPSELGNLVNLNHLLLSSNNLSGPIPPELGNLTDLTGLYLSSNNLSGCYPEEWCNTFSFFSFSNNPDLPDGGSDQGFLDFCAGSIECDETPTNCNATSINLGLDQSIYCEGETTLFINLAEMTSIIWNFGGETIAENTETITVSNAGLYSVEVTDECGNVGTDEIQVNFCGFSGDYNCDGIVDILDFIHLNSDYQIGILSYEEYENVLEMFWQNYGLTNCNEGPITCNADSINLDSYPDINCGDEVTLFINLAGMTNIVWSFEGEVIGVNVEFITVSNLGLYSVEVTDECGNVGTAEIQINEISTCVWPGDVNYDNIVNTLDFLFLGGNLYKVGQARINPSIDWIGQNSIDWPNSYVNGINSKHTDCDGNGQVNSDDIDAITQNYGKTHGIITDSISNFTKGAISFDKNTFSYLLLEDAGSYSSKISIDIELEGDTTPIHGIAWQIRLVDTPIDSFTFVYESDWFGTEVITHQHYSPDENTLDIAITRTDGLNISGDGKLGYIIAEEDNVDTWLPKIDLELIIDGTIMGSSLGERFGFNIFGGLSAGANPNSSIDTTIISQDSILLLPGWNLISLDVMPYNKSIESIFANLKPNNLQFVTSYENDAMVYNANDLPIYNTLNEINEDLGYWVYVEESDTLLALGTPLPANYRPVLNAGWNLTSFSSPQTCTPEIYYEDLIDEGNLIALTGFDPDLQVYNLLNPDIDDTLRQLENSRGYWIKTRNAVGGDDDSNSNSSNVFTFYNGMSNLSKGEKVSIQTLDGKEVGEMEVLEGGYLMTTPVYGVDLISENDDGVVIDEPLFFVWNGEVVDESICFSESLKVEKVDLTFTEPSVAIDTIDTSIDTSIDPIEISQLQSTVYPNPVVNALTIVVELPFYTNILDIIIYDTNGQQIKQICAGEHDSGKYNLVYDITQLPKGCYFYQVLTDNEIANGRFLKIE